MKYLFILTAATLLSVGSFAQGKGKGNGNGNGQSKVKVKEDKAKVKTDRDDNDGNGNGKQKVKVKGNSNDGVTGNSSAKAIGVPSKVQAAFARDYGNASGVTWTKSRGNWTASYNGGLFGGATSIATYHANGARMDTRTAVPLTQIPQPVTIWQQRVGPSIQLGKILRIDMPGQPELYQVTNRTNGQIVYVNRSGAVVSYTPR
jgi:hypothetical protein